jgi:hypothetical protein
LLSKKDFIGQCSSVHHIDLSGLCFVLVDAYATWTR